MVWDKSRPQGSEKIRNSDDLLRENNRAIEDALSEGHEFETGGDQSGKHVSPTFKDVGSDPDQPTKSNELRLYNKSGVLYTLDDQGKTRGLSKNTDIPSGTKMIFKQDSAPSGWTFKSEDNDRVLINASTEDTGGQTGGSWEIDSISVNNHTLSLNEIPNVTGTVECQVGGNGGIYLNPSGCFSVSNNKNRWASGTGGDYDSYEELHFDLGGGNGSHSHSLSVGDGWRPKFVAVITCEKD